jgi:chemotaxis protein methyltransferase CheR
MALPLSPQVFSILSQLVEEATGLHFDRGDADLFAEKLSVRAAELELDSLLDYYYFLRYDEGGRRELDLLVDLLVVNETYFFRERDQLEVLVDRHLAPLLAQQASVRVWCAACSTGEEPQSLAMLLDDRGILARVRIVASDISARVLAKAKAGVYGGRSLRALGIGDRARFFVEHGDGQVRPREAVRAAVEWARVNLFDATDVATLGRFDVILCRNVLIYFRDDAIARLVERLASSLAPRGLLCVGASESLLRFGTVFECEEHGGAFFYRKGTP